MTPQRLERLCINVSAIALPHCRFIRHESEPREIGEHRHFEFTPAALPIVVLDAQQQPVREFLHEQGIDRVSQVKEAGRRRRKPGYYGAHDSAKSSRAGTRVGRLWTALDDRRPDRSDETEAW